MAAEYTTTVGTFSSTTVSTQYSDILVRSGPGVQDYQVCRVSVEQVSTGSAPTGSGTVRFCLTDGTTVFAFVDATISQPSVACRTGIAGSSGNYLASVAFANGSDILDLAGGKPAGTNYFWKVGSPAAAPTNVTSLVVNLFPCQAV